MGPLFEVAQDHSREWPSHSFAIVSFGAVFCLPYETILEWSATPRQTNRRGSVFH